MIRYQKLIECEIGMAKAKELFKRRKIKCCKCSDIRQYIRDYTQHTTIHGIQYLGEIKRTIAEKIIWLIVIVTSIIVCSYLIWKSYIKWQTSPILITVGDALPVEVVTFPAITICPALKVSEELAIMLKKFDAGYQENISQSDKDTRKYTYLWCTYYNFDPYEEFQNDTDEAYPRSILKFIYDNSPSIDDVFKECAWDDYYLNCSEIFTPTFTEEGICYTFNSLNHSDLFKKKVVTFEHFNMAREKFCFDEYTEECKEKAYPYRISPRLHSGLNIVLKMPKNHSSPCRETDKGHNVIIHHPGESPQAEDNNFLVLPYESISVRIRPLFTITDEDLHSYYAPFTRKCFFEEEKHLKYFQYYTQNNCQRECYSTLARIDLNCSAYYMPHISTNYTSICNATTDRLIKKLAKYIVVNHHLEGMDSYKLMEDTLPKHELTELLETCTCFPPCKVLKYNFQAVCTDCDQRIQKAPRFEDEATTYYAEMNINFNDIEISPRQRKAIFGPMDFIAYCGGLLGLFIGFSLVSLLEFFYFFCCRPFCNILLYGRAHWTGHSLNRASRFNAPDQGTSGLS